MTDELISYDPRGAFLPEHGIMPAELAAIGPGLDDVRDEVLADAQLWADGVEAPEEKQPFDVGFHEMPDRLLAEYRTHAAKSEVGRIKAAADRLAGAVDSVIVLGIGGSYMGARALMEACRPRFYNELDAKRRGGRPRVYLEGNNVDGDALGDLIELVESRGDRWGVVYISKSGGTLETAAAFRISLAKVRAKVGGDEATLARFVIPVTGASDKLFDLTKALGCREVFDVPDGVGGRFSVLSAAGLLPAAIMGLDVARLLEGAVAMNGHFRNHGPAENIVQQYVGACHRMETVRGATIRVLSTRCKQLEAVGLWHDQLLSESLGKQERGVTPLTVVNTRDSHGRGQQHRQGLRDKLVTNLIVDRPRRPSPAIGASALNQDGLNGLAAKTLADAMSAAIAGTNEAYREDNHPTADLHLPRVDEFTLGQLFQMLMLAKVMEGRLIGVNPYGEPGVEAYKRKMNALLRK